ncbi:MAG TPA: peptidoglycan-associated lipoprotein Pal [Candidatus Acidoferrum sp.]|jgi:peptidoglycan-associated lipoprotein|nr:peptidoglycan-associated lipoprotein Pal [Candidatus Acidoferrum sp.]
MAHRRGSALLVVPVLVLSLFLAGCAKRPATTAASAPPPSGAPAPSTAAPSTSGTPGPAMTPSPAAPATGAPSTTPPSPSEFRETDNLKDVFFDFDKYDIRQSDAKVLDTNATWLKANDNLVLIEGHCDERGTNEYNLALGERRAKATMNYLVGQGVQANRITIISYGKERPTCTEHSEACWAKNRRAHFLVKAR